MLAVEVGVPDSAEADDDQDHGPIVREDRPRIEFRAQGDEQTEQADGDEDQPAGWRAAPPGDIDWVHHAPLYVLVRWLAENVSFQERFVTQAASRPLSLW
jgi:hypothetical protein